MIVVRDAQDGVYADFVRGHSSAMLYHGLKFRDFIVALLNVEPLYRMAVNDAGDVVGVMPVAASRGPKGAVLNSLPFFGSNGGILAQTQEAANALIAEFNAMARLPDVAAATLITNPLEATEYSMLAHDLTDLRIGQFTPLPTSARSERDIGAALMDIYHPKTRNMVRKAEKCVTAVDIENDAFDFLQSAHIQNMAALGGTTKPDAFFKLISENFESGADYEILIARIEQEPVAALLVFYFNETAEYYMPAVLPASRNTQALSLLVHRAMIRAVERGLRWWNWGGTWSSQHGVYQFKSRWGTQDKPYKYYVKLGNRDLLLSDREDLLRDYPYTYVVPFDALKPAMAVHG